MTPRSRRRVLWWAVGLAVPLVLAALFMFGPLRPHVFSGAVLQASTPAPEMEGLVYDDGEPVDIDALKGEVVLVYFGYTHCPDLCPTMLSTVNRALEGLGEEADQVETLMVTVDPVRDTPEYLADYVTHFNEGFRGVWGTEDDVRSVATSYGVHFEYDEPGADGNYLIGHTASLLAIDPEGVLRIVYPVGTEAEGLKADLKELLA